MEENMKSKRERVLIPAYLALIAIIIIASWVGLRTVWALSISISILALTVRFWQLYKNRILPPNRIQFWLDIEISRDNGFITPEEDVRRKLKKKGKGQIRFVMPERLTEPSPHENKEDPEK